MNLQPESTPLVLSGEPLEPSVPEEGSASATSTPRLEINGLSSARYEGGVSGKTTVRVQPCEVHLLTGLGPVESGMLARQFAGLEPSGAGHLLVDGNGFAPQSPQEAIRAGVCVLFREPQIIPALSIQETLMLVAEPDAIGRINTARAAQRARLTLAALGSSLSPEKRMGVLSLLEQRLVELARAFLVKPRLLVLEQFVEGISPEGLAVLLRAVRAVAAGGASVLWLENHAHSLKKQCDSTTAPPLTNNGAAVPNPYPRISHALGKPLFELDEVQVTKTSPAWKLTVRQGEILGVVAAPGHGLDVLLGCIAGHVPHAKGEMVMRGKLLPASGGVRSRLRKGIALAGSPLNHEGVLPTGSIAENLALARLGCVGGLRLISTESHNHACANWMQRLGIYARSPRASMEKLPPLAQRKIVLAGLLNLSARLLVLNEITAGLCSRDKSVIHRLIGEWASEGKAIIITSTDMHELLGICDTVALMKQGDLVEIRPASQWTEPEIIEAMTAMDF